MDGPGDGQSVTQDTRQKKKRTLRAFRFVRVLHVLSLPAPFLLPILPSLAFLFGFLGRLAREVVLGFALAVFVCSGVVGIDRD